MIFVTELTDGLTYRVASRGASTEDLIRTPVSTLRRCITLKISLNVSFYSWGWFTGNHKLITDHEMLCCSAIKFWKPKCKGFISQALCVSVSKSLSVRYSPFFSRVNDTQATLPYYCQMLIHAAPDRAVLLLWINKNQKYIVSRKIDWKITVCRIYIVDTLNV